MEELFDRIIQVDKLSVESSPSSSKNVYRSTVKIKKCNSEYLEIGSTYTEFGNES